MPKVTVIAHNGTRTLREVPLGSSAIQAAPAVGRAGIVAECGGAMMGAPCHVFAEPARPDSLPPISPTEDAMLDSTVCPRAANGRLSCQRVATPAVGGLVLRMPQAQT